MRFDSNLSILLEAISSRVKSSPLLRQNYGLRNRENDNSQRMLNALELETVMFETKDGN